MNGTARGGLCTSVSSPPVSAQHRKAVSVGRGYQREAIGSVAVWVMPIHFGGGYSMGEIFRRLLLEYAEYHRDGRNCWMHIIGNPILTLAAFLPFSLLPVTVFGVQTNAATLLVMPALLFWISLDLAIGLAIVVVAVPLLLAAAAIVSHVSVAWVWIITSALTVIGWAMQIIGHKYFEGNWPALVDNPMHMLMSPMYVFAKLLRCAGLPAGSRGARTKIIPADVSRFTALSERRPGRCGPTSVMQTLVTGGSGFIGQHLVALLAQDRRVRILDLRPPACGAGRECNMLKDRCSIRPSVQQALDDVDEVLPPRRAAGHVDTAQGRFPRRQLPRHGSRD